MAADPPRDEMEADDGCYTCDALRAISALGSCAEADTFDSFADKTWPYYELPYGDERANIDWPDDKKMFYALAEQEKSPKGCLGRTPPSKTCFANATHHRTLRYAHPQPMDDVNCWKSLLQGGYPIVFAINVYDTFESSTKEDPYIAKTPTENDKMKYGHIVMAVGWKDNVQDGVGAFRVQNSWGNWADEGFFWMGYDWLSSPGYQQDAWVLLDSEDS
ncbi:hypothetical protein E8E12_009049 [Didymella heteroderae]|uniref:Peptidase C1A papain C-terminal domain-containing protein n=1 Tax=Didymella heteroderae TaxID=1769908 RepID=A0A9P4WUT6_9PLEO|nr:hypothetical protein E8E12_009049 [Didymella heteroderae]